MSEALFHLFGAVCGQNPGHTWSPGGTLLPFCQRCTGLYLGACVAAILHLWLRPSLSRWFLAIHIGFLLVMAPFGFHWIEQGPAVRSLTGLLFGFGLVTLLRAPLADAATGGQFASNRSLGQNASRAGKAPARLWLYFGSLITTLFLTPLAAAAGGNLSAGVLAVLAVGGLLALAALMAADCWLAAVGTWRALRGRVRLRPQP
jgi:uncharacterized membrane protein